MDAYLAQHHLSPDGIPDDARWMVLRCERRRIATRGDASYAWQLLPELFAESFVPLKQHVTVRAGRRRLATTLAIPGIVFVRDTLDKVRQVSAQRLGLDIFQAKGRRGGVPLTVPDDDMANFIGVISALGVDRFYTPADYPKLHLHQRIRVDINGQLLTGTIQKIQGSKRTRLLVAIPDFILASVQIDLDRHPFIELVP